MSKIKYEVDPHNRLTILGPSKFRQVVDGEFKLDSGNSLTYHVKKSDNIDIPQQIKFSGDWSLGKSHSLILTLDKWNNQVEGNKLVLKSNFITASGDEVVFSVENRSSIYILRFSGAWQADKYNRLSFNVTRDSGDKDKLTLQGEWEINKQNEIIYAYPKNVITIRGHLDVTGKDRLSYVLNKGLDSQFNFNVAFERVTEDSLRYGISVGYGAKKRTIALFGSWKVDKATGLTFEIKYAGKGVKLEAKLSKSLLSGQAEGFIKTLVSEKEYAIMAGAGFKW